MSLRRMLAIGRKELWHISRDPRLLFLVTLSPAVLLLMQTYVYSFDIDRVTLAVLDWDRSAGSRAYLTYLTSEGDLELKRSVSNYAAAEDLLLRGTVNMALVIPHGFGDALEAGAPAEVQLMVDGLNSIAAQRGLSGLQARTRMFAARWLGVRGQALPVEVRGRVWYNPALKSLYSMVPGLMAVVLFMPAMAVTLALAREKETGSFEGLIATPVRGGEYLLGKLAAYMLTGLVGTLLALAVAVYWFRVPFRGDLGSFVVLTGAYFLATMGIGVFIANFVASQQTAMTFILLVFFVPSFFLAGLIVPVDTSQLGSQISSYALPPTHFIIIARGIFLKGQGVAALWQPALALLLMGLGTLGASLGLFKKKMG